MSVNRFLPEGFTLCDEKFGNKQKKLNIIEKVSQDPYAVTPILQSYGVIYK